jgi:hypothetical protein
MEMISINKLAIISFSLILLGFVGAFAFLVFVINHQNADKYTAVGTILAAIGTVGAFIFIGYQTVQLKNEFDLQHRPYLYVHLPQPIVGFNPTEKAWFGGGNLFFKNVGKDPATVTDTQYMVASDRMGIIKFVEWFERDFGGFPDIKTVMPGQEDAQVPCHPVISPADQKPRMFYIGAVITYRGPKPNKQYWYKFSQLFIVKFEKVTDKDGNPQIVPVIHPHKPDHEWDQNIEDSKPPKLAEPKWEDYLSKPYVKTLTGE